MTFPTATPPSQYTTVSAADRNGIFYAGDTVSLTLNKSGADAYVLRDYRGNTVASGSVSGTTISLGSGLDCGWYRIYLTGPTNDGTYGHSYGAYNFVVIRNTAGYATNPPFRDDYLPDPGARSGGESRDLALKAVMGFPFSRLQIIYAYDPESTGTPDNLWSCQGGAELVNTYAKADTARPQPRLCQFPGGTADYMRVEAVSGDVSHPLLYVYLKEAALDGNNIYVSAGPGTISGNKFVVYYPDSSTVVETYDNIDGGAGPARDAINAASDYIQAFPGGGDTEAVAAAPTAIGTAYRDGIIAVVQDLYPRGVEFYEGPSNEPRLDLSFGKLAAWSMKIFQESVHLGHPDAKAIGPCAVSLFTETGTEDGWNSLNGYQYCDEISTHAYNSDNNGDPNFLRASFKYWIDDVLDLFPDATSKNIWITESNQVMSSVYGVYHPQRSRVPILNSLVLEEFGIPREKNLSWYDVSHGFWSFPTWLEHGDGSLNPYPAMYRTLSEETFGKVFHHRIDMGSVHGNAMILGQVYLEASTDASTAVFVLHSYQPDASVTLTIEGTTDPITVVDAWGNETVVAQSSGRITFDIAEIPTYVQLPHGVHCWVYEVNDWGHNPPPSVSMLSGATLGGVANGAIVDNTYSGVSTSATGSLPDDATLIWAETVDVDRVLIWCGPCWQQQSTIWDFEVQTTANGGGSWTTRETVTKTTPASFSHPTSSNNAGCTLETFWDEQWIFDVKLPATYAADGVRVLVNETSYGGEPDAAAVAVGGQGDADQKLVIAQIAVPSASLPATATDTYKNEVLADNPIIYCRMGEQSGATAHSEVNSPTLDGTFSGTPQYGRASILGDGNTAIGTSFTKVNVQHNALLNVADTFTIEFMFAFDTLPTNEAVMVKDGGNGFPAVGFHSQAVYLASLSGGTVCEATVAPGTDFAMHHYAITKNGADVHIYVDGVDVSGTITNFTFVNNAAGVLNFAGGSGFPFNGSRGAFDEFALYGTALSSGRVATHYAAIGTPGGTPTNASVPLVAA